jgi:hypothetical protein
MHVGQVRFLAVPAFTPLHSQNTGTGTQKQSEAGFVYDACARCDRIDGSVRTPFVHQEGVLLSFDFRELVGKRSRFVFLDV